MSPLRRMLLAGLALLMGGSGTIHLTKPELYTPIVPRILGHAEFFVFWSGILQILAGLLMLVPRTRRWGAVLTMAILVAVFPANIQMALDGPRPGGGWFAGSSLMLWLRLPVQPLLVYWAWTFVRNQPAGLSHGVARPALRGKP
ncbi:MAG TPA: DoxX family protein [Actinomycetota bacterium]|nr:DoxX family protein [Actinomycetota bacterium]